MEDYAIRRREYIQQVRASFDEIEGDKTASNSEYRPYFDTNTAEEADTVQSFMGLKIRSFLAIVLFISFLFCKYTSYELFEYNSAEIIDMINDNQYYTILQKYVKL